MVHVGLEDRRIPGLCCMAIRRRQQRTGAWRSARRRPWRSIAAHPGSRRPVDRASATYASGPLDRYQCAAVLSSRSDDTVPVARGSAVEVRQRRL